MGRHKEIRRNKYLPVGYGDLTLKVWGGSKQHTCITVLKNNKPLKGGSNELKLCAPFEEEDVFYVEGKITKPLNGDWANFSITLQGDDIDDQYTYSSRHADHDAVIFKVTITNSESIL